MKNAEAFKALKAKVRGIRLEGADAFGTSPSRNGWLAIVIPLQSLAAAEEAARELGIKLYDPICSSVYGHHRMLNREKQAEETLANATKRKLEWQQT